MARISQEVTAPPDPRRYNKIAIFGDQHLERWQAKQLAIAIIKDLPVHNTVYTISTDLLGHMVRRECKKRGIKTYNRKVRQPEGEYDENNMKELTVAGLSWKVETFYCVLNELKRQPSFARFAIEIGQSMSYFVNCKVLAYNKIYK